MAYLNRGFDAGSKNADCEDLSNKEDQTVVPGCVYGDHVVLLRQQQLKPQDSFAQEQEEVHRNEQEYREFLPEEALEHPEAEREGFPNQEEIPEEQNQVQDYL